MTCPDDETLAAFVDGSLEDDVDAEIADHAARCETGHAVISGLAEEDAALAATSSSMTSLPVAQLDPVKIDRYQIVRRLGAGAMGIVYEAHDPELDRAIAIKLLRPGASADRLRREAQALAKLTHPNVVGVYDVGPHGVGTFVAMALVDGMTLRAWLQPPRTTTEILDAILQTARGVAAAHAAGIVHRDLKPDNIFVSHGGEVRVGDFGLARSEGAPESEGGRSTECAVDLTHTGTMLGTPAYMAPEQAHGEAVAASDQFSLCVTAWEAFYGARPFIGRTVDELIEAARTGTLVEPGTKRRVPRRIDRALRRGLAGAPEARHPSVSMLIDALSPRRPGWAMLAATSAVCVIAIAIGLRLGLGRAAADPCADPGSLAATWSPLRRFAMQASFARLADAAQGFAPAALHDVDAYVGEWTELRHQSCVAAQVRHEQRPETAEQIAHCLDQRAATARKLLDSFSANAALDATHALSQLEGLAPLERCLDQGTTVAPRANPEREQLEARVADLELEQRTGDGTLKNANFDDLIARAQAMDDAGLLADTLLLVADAKISRGETAEAERRLRKAMLVADSARDDRRRARAAATLSELMSKGGRVREATGDRELAVSALARAGSDPDVEIAVEEATAALASATHDVRGEIASRRRIVELVTARYGGGSIAVTTPLNRLALTLEQAGDPEFSKVLDLEAKVTSQLVAGPNTPVEAAAAHSASAMLRGDYAAAIRASEAAVIMSLRAPDVDTPVTVEDLGMTYEAAGRFADAEKTYHRTVQLIDGLSAAQPLPALLLDALEGQGRAALESIETPEATTEDKIARGNEALVVSDRALLLAKQNGGSDAVTIEALTTQRGRAFVALARWKDALPILRAAVAHSEAELPRRPFSVALRSFWLARTLWEIGDQGDRDHARVLGGQAATAFDQAHEQLSSQPALVQLMQQLEADRAELAAWRAARP